MARNAKSVHAAETVALAASAAVSAREKEGAAKAIVVVRAEECGGERAVPGETGAACAERAERQKSQARWRVREGVCEREDRRRRCKR